VNLVVSEAFAPILFQLGIGGIGGFFIGYAIRKVTKVALTLGIAVFSLMFLVYTNVIGIDYGGLVEMVSKFIGTINPALGLLAPLLIHLPFVGSLIIGLIIGFKKK
jgi:uncharacterized membrane protein (Fun14 family)